MAIMTNGGRLQATTREGIGAATAGQFDKFQMDATPKYGVGFQIVTADGKAFRYAQFDANCNRGVLVSSDISQVAVVDTDNVVIAPASATAVSFETPKPGALGSTVVQITLASVTVNQFLGGTFITTDDLGEGYTYDITGNTATGTPVSGDFYLFLRQKIQVALDNTTDFSIGANLWNNVEIATNATDSIVSGVACSTMVVATAAYGWVQTKGLCGVLQDANVPAVGAMVTLSGLTSGAVSGIPLGSAAGTVGTMTYNPVVGRCYDPGDSTGASLIVLAIE